MLTVKTQPFKLSVRLKGLGFFSYLILHLQVVVAVWVAGVKESLHHHRHHEHATSPQSSADFLSVWFSKFVSITLQF